MEKFFKWVFGLMYICAFIILCYLIYDFFVLQNKKNIPPLAITISAILASTAMARSYIQNARHEQQKIKRELFDRRLPIIKNIENIVNSFIHKKDEKLSESIDALTEQFFLIDFLFAEDEIKLLDPFIKSIIEFKTSNRTIDVNIAVEYYDEYLKWEIVNLMHITNSYEGLKEKMEKWKKQPKRLKSVLNSAR